VFDPTYPKIDDSPFINTDWKAIYGDVKDVIPIAAPTHLGKDVNLHLYVDSDYA
jgi:hypothetical protein